MSPHTNPRDMFLAVTLAAMLLGPEAASAGLIFSSTQTGHQLTTNANVTIHDTVDNDDGTSIDFIDGGSRAAFLEWSLLPSGSRGDVTVTINLDFTPLSGDNDLVFGLHDGTNTAAWIRADNNNGTWVSRVGLWKNDLDITQLSGAGGGLTHLGSVDPIEVVYQIPDGGGDTIFSATELDANGVSTTTNFAFTDFPLDGDAPLTFFFGRSDGAEDYRINGVSVEIDDADATGAVVPEPSSIMLSLLAFLSLLFFPRRSVASQAAA